MSTRNFKETHHRLFNQEMLLHLFNGLFFLLILTSSCVNDNTILLAETKTNINNFGRTTRLEMYSDSNYLLSFTFCDPYEEPTFLKGKYTIHNDSIYLFNDTEGDTLKAILQNGFIELLYIPRKIKLLKNTTSIKHHKTNYTSSDFTFFTYTDNFKNIFDTGTNTYISKKDIVNIRQLLNLSIREWSTKYNSNIKESLYVKQCISIINKKNEIEIWINGVSKESLFGENWEESYIRVFDGGDDYFQAKINLTRNYIYFFNISGKKLTDKQYIQ